MEQLASLASPFLQYLIGPIRRGSSYIFFYKSYVKELEEGVGGLQNTRQGVQHKCEEAERNAKGIEKVAKKWLEDVNVALQEAEAVLKKDDQQNGKGCFYLNPKARYLKGRNAKKTRQTVQQLNEERSKLGDVSYEYPHPIISSKDYESFASRSEIVKDIMVALSDASVSVIGVWGMGGVGKTTLMKEVMRLAEVNKLFNGVAMTNVSQNPDVKKIQGEIAVWLGLKLEDDENVRGRAFRLHKRLKNDKKSSTAEVLEAEKQDAKQKQVLIILDDLWRVLDLEEIGIPRDEGAVKLLFTSRNQHVLSGEMGCHKVYNLDVLKDEEPWRLFESIVGEKVGHDSTLRRIGKEVVKKCSGLPVVLKAIATTLKNCSLSEWRDALAQLRGSKDVYSNLEISYRHLESKELKSLFMVCALMGQKNLSVQDLFYYGMGLGLLKGANSTVRNARDRLNALLHSLQASSLLLENDNQGRDYVKIHDVVREVAIRIGSRDQYSFLITDGCELKEIPREKLKNSKAISIPYVNFKKFPERWECPELKMFLLYRGKNDSPIGISDSFFEGMRELRVMDFSGRCCDSLPSSIQLLLNLNTLCLDRCSMMDLTIIGRLKQLQILTFRGSEIDRLPKEIGELTDLKVLDLTGCNKLEIIEPQVLGNLTSLEELHMKGSNFKQWEDEREIQQPRNAKVSELNNMRDLSCVNIHIHDPTRIPKQLEFGNLVEYIILIGDVWDWSGDYKESRTLKIQLESSCINILWKKWLQDLLKRTQDLYLDGLMGRKKSIHELCLRDGFQELKHLYVQNSSSVHCITRSLKWFPLTAFTVLESLFLESLTEMEMISRGPLASDSFVKLKVIKVTNCGKLNNLFFYSILKGLSQLEEIEVRDCEVLREIVTVEDVATSEAVKLQALRRIIFHNLPNFMRFCSSQVKVNQTEMPSTEIISEDHFIPTNTLFLNQQLVSFPVLESLILSSLPKLKNIWQNNCPVEVANLKYLEVSSCDGLLTVIPSSLVTELGNLETLIVRDCGMVQELLESSDDDDVLNVTRDVEILSRLDKLELYNLRCLRHIWSGNFHHPLEKVKVFQNLKLLKVVNCNSLKSLIPFATVEALGQVTEIRIVNCEKMEEIISEIESDGGEGGMTTIDYVFHSLVDVWLENLPNMTTFVRVKTDQSINFLSLKELYVKECPKMRAFSLPKIEERGDESFDQLCFFDRKVLLPKIVRLDLISVTSMKNIWPEEIPEQSFCQLEILVVADCQNLVAVGIRRSQFQNLKHIDVRECTSLGVSLFEFAGEEKGKGYKKGCSLPQLEKLWLFDLPKLEHVLEPTSLVVLGFPNLVDIKIRDCQNLIDLLAIATAPTLSKLEELEISRCSRMRQVFGRKEVEEEEMMGPILFPCLRTIKVQNLDSLICFFLGTSCVLDFPSLEALDISKCPNLKTFVQRHTSDHLKELAPYTNEGVHYLFDDKVVFSNLKKMKLFQLSSLQAIWQNELPSFGTCRSVRSNLCGDIEILYQLDELELRDLPCLRHIGKVRVFQSLKSLKVANCNSLKSLFPFATFKALGQVTEICIENCEKMEEIISQNESDGGEVEMTTLIEPVVFHSLDNVWLENLPNTTAFVRVKRGQSINFLSLKELYVKDCPKMRAFSLPKIEERGDESFDQLCFFDRKVLLPKIVRLDLISVTSMKNIWPEEIPEQSFCQLEILVVADCQNLVAVGIRRSQFQNLKHIVVRECTSLGVSLFEFAGEEKGKGYKKGCSLPQLEKLWLFDLPKLEHVLEPTSHVVLGFPNLVDITIRDCQNLIDLLAIVTAPTLSKLEELEISRCSRMRQVFGRKEVEEEEEMMGPILFPCLRTIKVQNLDSLICFFLGTSCVLDFPSLEALDISKCPNLKTFVQRHTSDQLQELAPYTNEGVHYLFDDKVVFSNLKKMKLFQLSSLQAIWKNELPSFGTCRSVRSNLCGDIEILYQLDELELRDLPCLRHIGKVRVFQSLKSLKVANCNSLKSLFPFATVKALGQVTEIRIENCEKMEEIISQNESDGGEVEMTTLNEPVVFHSLVNVWLENLPNTTAFVRVKRGQSINFLSLKELYVKDCPKMRAFSLPKIEESGDESFDQLCFFDHKVLLPKIVRLDLISVTSMKNIWPEEIPEQSFRQLEILVVEDCQNLVALGIERSQFQNLKHITVRECSSLGKKPGLTPEEVHHFHPEDRMLIRQGFKQYKNFTGFPAPEELFRTLMD